MNERVKRLAEEAKKLTPDERVDLLDELFVSLHDHDAEVEKAWAVEIEKRWQRFKTGLDPAYESEEVLEDIRARLAKRRGA